MRVQSKRRPIGRGRVPEAEAGAPGCAARLENELIGNHIGVPRFVLSGAGFASRVGCPEQDGRRRVAVALPGRAPQDLAEETPPGISQSGPLPTPVRSSLNDLTMIVDAAFGECPPQQCKKLRIAARSVPRSLGQAEADGRDHLFDRPTACCGRRFMSGCGRTSLRSRCGANEQNLPADDVGKYARKWRPGGDRNV